MMDGAEFIKSTDGRSFYIEACLKSIIYGYNLLASSNVTYSRASIQKKIRTVLNSENSLNEIEDYLCDDLIANYVKPNKHLFGLENFAINTGVRESFENVKVGVIDIKFELPTLWKNHYYIFEAKRLDKYSQKQQYYIEEGIGRFTNGHYYAESNIVVAGMIGFIEVDLKKYKKGRASISSIKDLLNKRIDKNTMIKTLQNLQFFYLKDDGHSVIGLFRNSYLSKHTRSKDSHEILIHHLFLDYYDILFN